MILALFLFFLSYLLFFPVCFLSFPLIELQHESLVQLYCTLFSRLFGRKIPP